ncbi:MAG: DNRLRE domain-containing protein [Ignavibacteriae bacterium]|nr:DNRLRE domain-containing protein [Ignavibacteriota bacterium]
MNQIIRIILILLVFAFPLFYGCENNISDEGLSYISSDTLGTFLLDSQIDTVNIVSNNFIKYINTTGSPNMLVGKYSNYESKSLLKFKGLPTNYDTATVLSAKLKLRYNKTFYQDSLGITSFNIYRINKYYDFSTLTYDKFYNEIGTNILGTYTGTPIDTSQISITLDNQTVQDWFKYAHDTNYVNKNYGIVLLANSNSNTVKAFYSSIYGNTNYIPSFTTVMTYPSGRQDTLSFSYSEFISLNYVPQINTIPGRIILQNGVAIKDILKFDVSKLPGKVIINQATLEMKIDWANTFYTKGIDTRLTLNMLTDTSTLANDGITYLAMQTDSNTFTLYFREAVQKWNYGVYPNLGILLKNIYDYSNLDRYVFYGPDYPDASKRPRIKIRYSLRR